jgi:putative transcriptional regulator
MNKPRHSRAGKRLIRAMKEVVDHVEGRIALPMRYVEVPEDVDLKAIRVQLGLSQAEFAWRYAVSPRSLQEWEQGRRPPKALVGAISAHKRQPGSAGRGGRLIPNRPTTSCRFLLTRPRDKPML